MTITYREAGEGSSVEMVEEAQSLFIRTNRLMRRFIEDWEDGRLEDFEELSKTYERFRKELPIALKERERLESERAKRDGIAGDRPYALDFDAARHEIGRRLACLSAQIGAGGVSE